MENLCKKRSVTKRIYTNEERLMMIQVTVKVYSILKELIGRPTLTVEVPNNSAVREVLKKVVYQFKDNFNQRYRWEQQERDPLEYFVILINKTHISNIGGFEAKVKDGDTVEIMEPISGG